jgi:hypothetical protein
VFISEIMKKRQGNNDNGAQGEECDKKIMKK